MRGAKQENHLKTVEQRKRNAAKGKGSTSLLSSCFLSFSRRRSNKRAIKRASAWGEQKNREKWGRGERDGLTPSPYSLFFAISRSFRPLRERLEKERKRLLRRLGKHEWTQMDKIGQMDKVQGYLRLQRIVFGQSLKKVYVKSPG